MNNVRDLQGAGRSSLNANVLLFSASVPYDARSSSRSETKTGNSRVPDYRGAKIGWAIWNVVFPPPALKTAAKLGRNMGAKPGFLGANRGMAGE
jgi:hypothetical protein